MCGRRISLIIAEKSTRPQTREENYFAYERQMFGPCRVTFSPCSFLLIPRESSARHPSAGRPWRSSRTRTRNQALLDPGYFHSPVPPPELFPEGWLRWIHYLCQRPRAAYRYRRHRLSMQPRLQHELTSLFRVQISQTRKEGESVILRLRFD
jgi:hypothetical protein